MIYGFLLLLLYLQTFLLAIVQCFLCWFTASYFSSCIFKLFFWLLSCLSCRWFTVSYFSSCIFKLFFWLLSCLSFIDWFTASYFSSCIFKLFFWLLSCLSFVDLRLLTSPLVTVCPSLIYGFLLLLLYLQTFLLAIVLSVRRWFTVSYFSSCIFKLFFWLLSCLSFVDLRLLTSPLVSSNFSFGYCPVCPLLIYGFLLLLLYLQTFLLLLSCLSVADLRIFTSPLVSSNFSFSYCPVCPLLIYEFLLLLLYLQTYLLSSWFTSYFSSFIFNFSFGYCPVCPLLIYGFLLLLLYLQTFLLAIVLSVRRWFTDSYFSSCLQTFRLAIVLYGRRWFTVTSPLVSSNFSFGDSPVCPSLIFGFLLLLLYLQTFLLAIVLSVCRWFTDSYFSSCIFKLFFWLLSCLSFVDLRLLTSPLVSSNFSFGYCPVCPSLIYGFLLLLLYLQTFLLAIVLSVLYWFTLLTSPLVSSNFSFGYCPVSPLLIYGFLLLLLYLQTFLLAIVLSVLCWFTASYFSSCIFKLFFWLLSCLSFIDLRLLTSPLVSSNFYFGYCPVCPLLIYGFLLLLFIFKLFFWLLSCLSFIDLRLLTSPLVSSNFSFGYCPVCPLLIYGFLLLLLYLKTFLLAIVLSVFCWFTASYFSSCIFKPFFWL